MKFIHAADLHIDSPLRGVSAYEGAPVDQLRTATNRAFERLVELAIAEEVAFVVLAGDLFDGQWTDAQTGLWTAKQFQQLGQHGIEVYLLRGNHDAASRVPSQLTWPANVHEFSCTQAETYRLPDHKVALHGQGFAHQTETRDLAAAYPDPVPGWFNIGVLHTSLTGSEEHDTYAPTTIDVLKQRGYEYWALGHIHQRSVPPLTEEPFIAYSGNTQGRHIRETGPKGCLLLTVTDHHLTEVVFRGTSVLRWAHASLDLTDCDAREDLVSIVRDRLAQVTADSAGQTVALRVALRGATALHQQLTTMTSQQELIAEIRNLANETDGGVWIEKVVVGTRPPVDYEQLIASPGLLGDLFRQVHAYEQDAAARAELLTCFEPLLQKAAKEVAAAGLRLDDPALISSVLERAQAALLARLAEVDP